MHRHLVLAAVGSLAVAACSSATVTDSLDQQVSETVNGPISLASLQPGDILTVHIESGGCYHQWRSDLTFEYGTEGHVTVAATASPTVRPLRGPADSSITASSEPEAVPLATLEGLDQVLKRLRAPQKGLCTTQSDYRLMLYREGHLIREEQLHDAECGEDPASFYPLMEAALDQAYAAWGARSAGA